MRSQICRAEVIRELDEDRGERCDVCEVGETTNALGVSSNIKCYPDFFMQHWDTHHHLCLLCRAHTRPQDHDGLSRALWALTGAKEGGVK